MESTLEETFNLTRQNLDTYTKDELKEQVTKLCLKVLRLAQQREEARKQIRIMRTQFESQMEITNNYIRYLETGNSLDVSNRQVERGFSYRLEVESFIITFLIFVIICMLIL